MSRKHLFHIKNFTYQLHSVMQLSFSSYSYALLYLCIMTLRRGATNMYIYNYLIVLFLFLSKFNIILLHQIFIRQLAVSPKLIFNSNLQNMFEQFSHMAYSHALNTHLNVHQFSCVCHICTMAWELHWLGHSMPQQVNTHTNY